MRRKYGCQNLAKAKRHSFYKCSVSHGILYGVPVGAIRR